jgi:uncharacterized membrane-anchored protein YhcB (DUF1043 family)
MELALTILIVALIAAVVVMYLLKDKADKRRIATDQQCQAELEAVRARYTEDSRRVQQDYAQRVTALEEEAAKIRAHYEEAARQAQEASQQALEKAQADAASLAKYAELRDAEAEVAARLKQAIAQAEALHDEAMAAWDDCMAQSIEDFQRCLESAPAWAAGLPLGTSGEVVPYYRK